MPTRRQVLAAVGIAGTVAVTGRASASHPTARPEAVTLSYDEATLKQYRPKLILRNLDVEPLALHGWVARSPDRETDVCVYWAEYTHQNGVSEYDSHFGDHEPVYVAVDSESGAVREVVASVYHWLRGRTTTPTLDGQHPLLRVISPWHHYTAAAEVGQAVALANLDESFDGWLANGLESDLHVGSVTNPWVMLGADGRTHWWQDTAGLPLTETRVRIFRALGIHESGEL